MSGKTSCNAIRAGEIITQIHKQMTQEIINKWADVVEDYNPLHVDPEYAKKTKFKTSINSG